MHGTTNLKHLFSFVEINRGNLLLFFFRFIQNTEICFVDRMRNFIVSNLVVLGLRCSLRTMYVKA